MPSPAVPRFVDRLEDLPPPGELAARSGMEIMQGVLSGRLPAPPICRTLGFWLTEVGEGRAVFEGEPGFEHYNVLGGVHGGWFGTLLDSCMGCAVHTRLPRGKGYTTLEYKVNIIRANSTQVEPLSSHPARRLPPRFWRLAGRNAWWRHGQVRPGGGRPPGANPQESLAGPLEFSPNPARRRLPVAPLRTARRRLVSRKIGAAERFYLGGTCSRPAGPETGVLRATGEAAHVGRRTGVAEGRLVDAAGRLYAQGSTTCLIFDF